jgi:hypothetical protein
VKVFYCWQSDRPADRNLIEDALDRALKVLSTDEQLGIDKVLDRDTSGVPGTPDIAPTIFQKIRESGVFVADVTLVIGHGERRSPNPNVMVEVGYAFGVLDEKQIILVMNIAAGSPEQLPFDLRHKRVMKYSLAPESDKASVRKYLVAGFEQAIRLAAEAYLQRPTPKHLLSIKLAIDESLQNTQEWLAYVDRVGFEDFHVNSRNRHPNLASPLLAKAVVAAASISAELYKLLSETEKHLQSVNARVDSMWSMPMSAHKQFQPARNVAIAAEMALEKASAVLASLKAAA